MNNSVNMFGVKNKNKMSKIMQEATKLASNHGLKINNSLPSKLNNSNKNNSACESIPHMETVGKTQMALGRVTNLTRYGYYKCRRFTTMNIQGKQHINWSIRLNDLIIYYGATRMVGDFPIRFIDSPIKENNSTKILVGTVTNREQKQLFKFFNMYKYKSNTHQGVYFFSHKPYLKYDDIVRV